MYEAEPESLGLGSLWFLVRLPTGEGAVLEQGWPQPLELNSGMEDQCFFGLFYYFEGWAGRSL